MARRAAPLKMILMVIMMMLAGVLLLLPGAAAAHAAAAEVTAAAPGPTPPAWTWQQEDQRARGLSIQTIMRGVAAAKQEVKAALANPAAAFEDYLQTFAAQAAQRGHLMPGGLGDSHSRAERMQVWLDNLRAADAFNSNASNTLVARGITHFAHLTQQEFAKTYLGQNFSSGATTPAGPVTSGAGGAPSAGAAAGMDGVAGEAVLDDGGWDAAIAEATAAAAAAGDSLGWTAALSSSSSSRSSSSPAARRMLSVRATFVASDVSGLDAELTPQVPAPAAAAAAGVLPPAAATPQPRCSGLRGNPYDGPATLPSRVDWVSAGGTASIRDQGACGSCVAFAATALAEFMHMRKFGTTNTTTDLSEQDLLECTAGNGCHGQHQELYPDLLACAGVALEAHEPYRAANEADSCQRVQRYSGMSVAGGGGWAYVLPDTDHLARALSHAPVMLSMDAGEWQMYRGGVLGCDARRGGSAVNHAVVLVGYYDGVEVQLDDGAQGVWDVFIVRNSWGTWWGSGNGGGLAGHLLVRKDCPARATTPDDLGIVPVFG